MIKNWLGSIMKEALDRKLNPVILKASFCYILIAYY